MRLSRNNIKWITVLAVLALLIVSQPSSNPVFVQRVDGATYSHDVYAQWKDETAVSTVKGIVSWTTTDPSFACYDSRRDTGRDNFDQSEGFDHPTMKCGGAPGYTAPWLHEYPTSSPHGVCWVAKAIVYTVQIDSCDVTPSWWNSPNYFYTFAIHYRLCAGIINTPFSICNAATSMLHTSGSLVWVHYSGG